MLEALPDDYPEGDMRGEALFRVALARMAKGDWAGAIAPLERIVSIEPNDLRWATAARALYFRARASAMTGDREDAANRYAAIVSTVPLAFYMTQAYARLAAIDPDRAKRTLDEAVARESAGPLLTHDHDELRSPPFATARRLLEVGELDDARRELTSAHLWDAGVDAEVLWAVAQMYNAAGAPEIGHAFARQKITDFLAHYPAGRWRACWEIAFPRAFEDLVTRSSTANAIPTTLTWAIMREESSFFAEAKSNADAFGLMQLIVPTARGVARGTGFGWDETSLKRPEVSIALGTKLLAGLRASFPANRALAIAAYNGGGGAVGRWVAARPQEDFDLWVEQIPYDETRGYIKRVLASETAYAFLYAPTALDEVLAIPTRVSK
jgi:soluble lytic murein transglycosylase